jgi:hypothetical protein
MNDSSDNLSGQHGVGGKFFVESFPSEKLLIGLANNAVKLDRAVNL